MATGQYRKQNLLPSDLDVTTVKAAAAPTTAYTGYITDGIDCRGFREVDFFVDVASAGSITKLTVLPQAGQALDSTTVEYASYMVESLSDASGVATTYQYEVELNDPAPSDTPVYKVTVPVEGRYVRLKLKSDSATGSVGIYAQRRV
tara:strand:- start:68 stop:508 length:441 start_codon:yes stop_codon:yes gene_type:complete